MSASAEMLECGKMKSHVPATAGYCAFGNGDTETQSVSHNIDISFTSARVNVIVVSAYNPTAPSEICSAKIRPKTRFRRIEWVATHPLKRLSRQERRSSEFRGPFGRFPVRPRKS